MNELPDRLLEYWYRTEFFQPSWPIREREDIDLSRSHAMPWLGEKPQPDMLVSFDIYLGRGISDVLIQRMLHSVGEFDRYDRIEPDLTPTCLCALKVTQMGVYVAGSFGISSFVWALGRMIDAKDFRVPLDMDDLKRLQADIDAALLEHIVPLGMREIKQVLQWAYEVTHMTRHMILPSTWAHRIAENIDPKARPKQELKPHTELVNSFYVDDIQRIRNAPNERILTYIQSLASPPSQRTEIDIDVQEMQDWLKADRYPRGAWPCTYTPSLMQQIAINIGSSDTDAFSVNGPPGTGKTTLLKEIVASHVVQRAALLEAYDVPNDAFEAQALHDPSHNSMHVYYEPNEKITHFGILVASNNNAAVENLSKEMPKAIGAHRTGLFASQDLTQTYFSDVATALLDERGQQAWGLISARMGNKANIQALKDRLRWDSKGPTVMAYYDQDRETKKWPVHAPPDWNAARRDFRDAWNAVEAARQEIARAQDAQRAYVRCDELRHACMARYARALQEKRKAARALSEAKLLLRTGEERLDRARAKADAHKARLPWPVRRFPDAFARLRSVRAWRECETARDAAWAATTQQQTIVTARTQALDEVEDQIQQLVQAMRDARQQQQSLRAICEAVQQRYGCKLPDDAFWRDIRHNEDAQIACPWTHPAYDALRERLFYRALMLHKAFLLNSLSAKKNLHLFLNAHQLDPEDRKRIYAGLLNTLFLFIPVLSTTFASVHTFLENVGPEALGLLVVDESGQATPQSALGAIWRTRRSIVVGDPLQVEPILCTPKELARRFADDTEIPTAYRAPELSVQNLADAANPYGRTGDDDHPWLGCPLVVHRRCVEPMFTMSNRVAYGGRMFRRTREPANLALLLDESTWFDAPGAERGARDHTVEQHIDVLCDLMRQAFARMRLPDIYVITPFTSVRKSAHDALKALMLAQPSHPSKADIDAWLKTHCGTIHTFQGKEANEVILVLGCDDASGRAAALWVGQKPNIINVAVSRARYRIAIIGDYGFWSRIPHVRVICEEMRRIEPRT